MRAPKYRNVRVTVDGIDFASKKEAKRYGELKLLEKAGRIRNLALQPRFPLKIRDRLVCTYVGDFSYVTCTPLGDHDQRIVEDVKGFKTDVYKLKAKLFEAVLGFPIREV